MTEQFLTRHVFKFNPKHNGGESLLLTTEFFANGDKPVNGEGIFTNQELSLSSYGNSASFNLASAALTPENLRQLANELEQTMWEAKKVAETKDQAQRIDCR